MASFCQKGQGIPTGQGGVRKEKMMEDTVRTYDPAEFGGSGPEGPGNGNGGKRKMKKGILIFLIILACFIVAALLIGHFSGPSTNGNVTVLSDGDTLDLGESYIGVLHIEGTISESSSDVVTSSTSYSHQFLMDCVDDMMQDEDNKGILLYENSPGGSVYASDELYLKLEEYKRKTGRPIYTYMASEACSGAYYIASASDKIIANRNCWTGSIGVLISTIYDVSGLLDKLGISAVTIKSGKNKSMGSATTKMTKEQKQIFQSLVDEAYDQFVGIVAKGRDMSEKKVRKLADGRVYTARQAKQNGLVDQIAGYESAALQMKKDCHLEGVSFQDIQHEQSSLLDQLLAGTIEKKLGSSETTKDETETDRLASLLEDQYFTLSYLTDVRK